MNRVFAVSHNKDLDGWCSGAIVKLKYPNAIVIGYDYGEPLDWMGQLAAGDILIMTDISIPMNDMYYLAHSGIEITWIDHHISAIKDYKQICEEKGGEFVKAVLDNTKSACEGTWNYFFPDKSLPEAVLLLGEYDTWRNKDKYRWDSKILPFQFGMRVICNSVDSFPIYLFGKDLSIEENKGDIESITKDGVKILKYQSLINESNCNKAAFECTFEGLRAICLNGAMFNSDTFKSVYDEEKHDVMIPFQYDGKRKKWNCSLYGTKDTDLSVIAKKYGGGGHKSACGFSVDDIHVVIG